MNDSYKLLIDTLKEKNIKRSISLNNLNEVENKFQKLVEKFTTPTNETEINKILKEKLINQYEEKKSDITFATLIEKLNEKFLVYYIIFDVDFTYSNLLLKEFDSLNDAENYFKILKQHIIDDDINLLSNFILNNL